MHFPGFKDKVVLITGAAGGIGQSLYTRFQENAAQVFTTDVRESAMPLFVQGDIADSKFITCWVESILSKTGRIDILINNAGICPRTPLFDISEDEWNKVITINLTSTFLLSQVVMKSMLGAQGGAIVNLASMAGKVGGIAVGAHYSASKAAIQCLTKTLARNGAPHGVRVNAVAPGIIDTDITRAAKPEQIPAFLNSIPLGRLGRADEVAQPVMFLASNLASYITGVTLDINGGLLMD